MQMNKQKLHRLVILLVLLVFSVLVVAQGTDQQEPAAVREPTRSEETTKASPQASEAEPDAQPSEGEAPEGSTAVVTPIKEFKPTEQIKADSAVSFPIDI